MINIYHWSSGVTDSTGIQGLTSSDLAYYKNYNRPLHRLYDNDASIVNSIDSSVLTDKLYVSSIHSRTGSEIVFSNDVIMQSNVFVLGSFFTIFSDNVSVYDNIITLNASNVLSSVGGIEIDRGTQDKATLLFDESDKYWHFSHSGISVKNVQATTITASQMTANYVDFDQVSNVGSPPTGFIRLHVDYNSTLAFVDSVGNIKYFADNIGRFRKFIDNQTLFEDYFGDGTETGSGTTTNGWDYSEVASQIRVYPPVDEKVLLDDGSYLLKTHLCFTDGFVLNGKNFESCKVIVDNSNVGLSNFRTSDWVDYVELDNFTIDGDNISLTSTELFNLQKMRYSRFGANVINCGADYVYNGNSLTYDISFGDAHNNMTVFKNLKYLRAEGTYFSNLSTCNNCQQTIIKAIIDSQQRLGIGEFNF